MPTKSLELNHTIKLIQKLTSGIDRIEKEYVCHSNPTFTECLSQKRAEGKHYNVAISHAVKNWFNSFIISKKQTSLNISNSILLEHLQRCSFCHTVFKVQRTPTEFKIYLKHISVLY